MNTLIILNFSNDEYFIAYVPIEAVCLARAYACNELETRKQGIISRKSLHHLAIDHLANAWLWLVSLFTVVLPDTLNCKLLAR